MVFQVDVTTLKAFSSHHYDLFINHVYKNKNISIINSFLNINEYYSVFNKRVRFCLITGVIKGKDLE